MIRRVVEGGTFLLLGCLTAGGYMALRAMAWHYESEAGAAALAGVNAAAIICGAIAGLYVLIGAPVFRWISRQIDWMSVELGMIVGAALYAVYSVTTSPIGTAIDPAQRALQGAMDGLIMGAGIGLVGYIAIGRKARLTFTGLIEYVVIFLIMLCALQLAQVIETWSGIPDYTAGMLVLLVLAGLVRLTLYLFDRLGDGRAKHKHSEDQHPAEADAPHEEHGGELPIDPIEPSYTEDAYYDEGYLDDTVRSSSSQE
ncbi:MAG: hypothetical protein U0670_11880 [Anaerolineae bacterium]